MSRLLTTIDSIIIAGHFDALLDAPAQHRVHRLMEEVHGYSRSHWMPLSGECLHCIALAASKVAIKKTTTKNASNSATASTDDKAV